MTPEQRKVFDAWAADTGYNKPKEKWVGLVSPQGGVEYNARFVVGDSAAEALEHGKWYTNEELANIGGKALFLRDSSGSVEKNVKKWKVDKW